MHTKITHRGTTDNTLYTRLAKLWLISILLILPFQLTISSYIAPWSSRAAAITNNLDEITIVIFLLLATVEFCKNKKLSDVIPQLLVKTIKLVIPASEARRESCSKEDSRSKSPRRVAPTGQAGMTDQSPPVSEGLLSDKIFFFC